MKDLILIFALVIMLWAWFNIYTRRIGKQKRMDKETRQIALKRFNHKRKSQEKRELSDTAPKKIDDVEQASGRFKMNAYPYLQQELRSGEERRKSRVKIGIIFEYIDRRQGDSTLYRDPERRIGMDRRGEVWDRRKPKILSGFTNVTSGV